MRYAWLAVLVLVGGCGNITGAEPRLETTNRVRMDPAPGLYPRWYAEAEACVERVGDFDAVRWYRADHVVLDGKEVGGVLEFPHDVTIAVPNVHVRSTVKHEAIHHILQRGDDLHGSEIMIRCSGEIVAPWD